MAEQKQGGSSSEMTAGPNVNELVWALNASAAVEDAEASGEPQGDLEDDSEAEEAGASSSQQPESGGSAVTSSKKKKKKSGKTKAALSKLKDKLHKDPSAASDSAPSEEQVEALQSQIKSRVAAEHGQDLADQMTPDVVAQILQQAKLQDLRANGPDGSPLSSHVKKYAPAQIRMLSNGS